MDFETLPQLVRNTGRFREITGILAKYGFARWLGNVPADWVRQLAISAEVKSLSQKSTAVRIRLALAELGTTFIKLGQILSTRPDLVGPELAGELKKLQSNTPADPPELVRQTFAEELRHAPEELFAEFELEAFASASIAQVHRATTREGQAVVVKVQHHGIEDRIKNDLEILVVLARMAERFAPQLKQLQPVETATQFSRTLLRELDFTLEVRNLQQFEKNFRSDDSVRFPTPYESLCSRRVLTMDLLEGTSLSDNSRLVAAGVDLGDVARRGASMFVEMIFRDGFYHADPHPGNLMVLAGDALGVLDCGMVGRIDDQLREQMEDLLLAALDRDAARMTELVVRLGRIPSEFDRDRLQSDLDDFIADIGGQSMDDFDLSGALNGLVGIIRRHHIVLPARIALLLKVLIMLEGTSQQLSPDFSLVELLEPYRTKAIQRRLSPARMWKKLQTAYRDWNHLLEIIPGDLANILSRVKQGSFNIHLEHRRLELIVNRLVLGIITAALFVGSATLWSREVPPILGKFSLPGTLGCLVAVLMGTRLVWQISRSSYDP